MDSGIDVEKAAYFPVTDRLGSRDIEALADRWDLSYLHLLEQDIALNDRADDGSVEAVPMTDDRVSDGIDIYERTYLRRHQERLSVAKSEALRAKLDEFFRSASDAILYRTRDSRCIGVLAIQRDYRHPWLDFPTVHIGFLAYDSRQTTQDQARAMKADWLLRLREARGITQRPASARIQWFNEPSLRFFESRGFRPKLLEISENR